MASSSISPATQLGSSRNVAMSRGLFAKPTKKNHQMTCQASSISAERVRDMEKRKLLNLLLVSYQIQATRVSLPPILEIEKRRTFTKSSLINDESCKIRGGRARRRMIAFALETGGDSQDQSETTSSALGSTRLGRIAIALGKQLLVKINSARRNFPMKIFLLLLGFYTANALATILGQTGDWDVLVAGIVVAAIEGIGMLMYRKKKPSSFVVFMNFWKAGVCLGLFVDAFKLGS